MFQRLANGFGADPSGFEFAQRRRQTTRVHITGAVMCLLAADMVLVFGQVGQMAEIGEGTNDAHGLVAAQ